MRLWMGLLALLLAGAVWATPPMPPRPPTPHAAQGAAVLFQQDAGFLQTLARHERLAPLLQDDALADHSRLPIDLMHNEPFVGTRPPSSWAYESRRYVEHFRWQVIQKRFGTDEVAMTSDGSFPLLVDAARIIHGAALLVVPDSGAEKLQSHLLLFDVHGHLRRGSTTPADATAGVVRFADAHEIWDVTLPYDGRPITVTQFIPPDRSFGDLTMR